MALRPEHVAELRKRGLSDDTIAAAGLYSANAAEVKAILGFSCGSGLVIPYEETYKRVRLDLADAGGGRYRSQRGARNRMYSRLRPEVLEDSTVPLYVTESEFKALKGTQEGFPTVGFAGVWSWRTKLHGVKTETPDLDRVSWDGRTAIVVFDSDAEVKPQVSLAEHALCLALRERGAKVHVIRLPDGPKGEKYGLDDFLVAKGADAFRALPMRSVVDLEAEAPTFLRMADLADQYLASVRSPESRLRYGIPALDSVTRGLATGEVLTILGRSGVGKTAFLLNLLGSMTQGTHPALFFSLEQPAIQVYERVVSMVSGRPGHEVEALARIEDPDMMDALYKTAASWDHVVTVEKPCSVGQLDHLIEGARSKGLWRAPLRLVAVDYLGMLTPDKPGGKAYEYVSEMARELKRIAKRHRVALITACQVGRQGESGGTALTLRSARDSGVIEESADHLWGIWRPSLSEELTEAEKVSRRSEMTVRILKQRNGPAPITVPLTFDGATLRVA